jgi:hypothetical protein
MKKPDFQKDLLTGQAGEELLHKMFPELVRLDGKHADFITPDFQTLELKSDSYSMGKTKNYFIERWSDVYKKRPGGLWQAFGRGTNYFAYLYVPDKTCFVFRTHELITFLEQHKFSEVYIRNRGWTTSGYKVPRALVAHLVVKILKADDAKEGA